MIRLYACLVNYQITKGHCVVVWKKNVSDLHLLSKTDYEHLMDSVELLRNAMLRTLKVKKVYLIYIDEAMHVNWHLVPRYTEQGYYVLNHRQKKTDDFSLAKKIKANLLK